MLTILENSRIRKTGLSRRDFLSIGALGSAVTLADMLRAQASATDAGRSRRRKSAILIYLGGGPSHLDTYDLKPAAPLEIRGEFQPIRTNVAGIDICEHFPLQAKLMEKLTVLRSVVSKETDHFDSIVMTGYTETERKSANRPSFGSVVSKVRGMSAGMPAFVSLRGMTAGISPGYLGRAHQPFVPSGELQADLRLPTGVTRKHLGERKQLLDRFDKLRRKLDHSSKMKAMSTFQNQAWDMILSGSVRQALKLAREDPKTLRRYSRVEPFLKARRLIEAGVGCVTLSVGEWDTHRQNFSSLKQQMPLLDRGLTNLIEDFHDRGLADDVVTIAWGEFGRTPVINKDAGRDHWPTMSALVAGGGLRMGQVIGATTARGEQPQKRPLSVSQVLATVYRAIGVDPGLSFQDFSGRPVHVLDDREPVRELF